MLTLAAAVTLAATAAAAAVPAVPVEFRIRIRTSRDAYAAQVAMTGAYNRWQDPSCREPLLALRDSEGRTLRENVPQGVPEELYPSFIVLMLAQSCPSGILAMTKPGSRIVGLCPRFTDQVFKDQRSAEVALLHEALHTLGLGEIPGAPHPGALTAPQITEVVKGACR
jgi:hypothetical protein